MKICNDPALSAIAEKVHAGRRLNGADGVALLATRDIHTLGELADAVRRRLHGQTVYYNVNRHINYTNVCVLRCRFCGFARRPGGEGAYELSVERVAELAAQAAEAGATEVHLTGGLHPRWQIDRYEAMLQGIGAAAPRLHVKAFTAVEIAHIARSSGLTCEVVLRRLIDVGLASLPGGGAEIFDPRVHDETFEGKIGQDEWLDVHRLAHRLGLPTNATMLYGHVETPAERVEHLLKLRRLQDQTAGLQCIVPLSFIPDDTALARQQGLTGPTGLDDLRTLAATRLIVDNVPHVKSFWVMQGLKLSELALDWGVDDLDGTVVWYGITRRGGADTHQEVTVPTQQRLIRQGGRVPVERDSLYRRVVRNGGDWRIEPP